MNVQQHHTPEELRSLALEHRGTMLGTRLQAVVLARSGQTALAIAQALGFDRKTIVLWINHYNTRQLDGLVDHFSPGRPCELNPEQLQALKNRLD